MTMIRFLLLSSLLSVAVVVVTATQEQGMAVVCPFDTEEQKELCTTLSNVAVSKVLRPAFVTACKDAGIANATCDSIYPLGDWKPVTGGPDLPYTRTAGCTQDCPTSGSYCCGPTDGPFCCGEGELCYFHWTCAETLGMPDPSDICDDAMGTWTTDEVNGVDFECRQIASDQAVGDTEYDSWMRDCNNLGEAIEFDCSEWSPEEQA